MHVTLMMPYSQKNVQVVVTVLSWQFADVSHYVRLDSPLNEEAGRTWYIGLFSHFVFANVAVKHCQMDVSLNPPLLTV